MEFLEFPKMARLTRECYITEKIDGTNAQVHIVDLSSQVSTHESRAALDQFAIYMKGDLAIFAGSRTKYLTVGKDGAKAGDNFGFAKWVNENAADLLALGVGRHYGEWWGSGIQRGYGLLNGEKRFSLFNTSRWVPVGQPLEEKQEHPPACCSVVPVLYRGLFGPKHDENYIAKLKAEGSMAAPGFMKPEGIVVYHVAAGVSFKKTIEKDEQPKSMAKSA